MNAARRAGSAECSLGKHRVHMEYRVVRMQPARLEATRAPIAQPLHLVAGPLLDLAERFLEPWRARVAQHPGRDLDLREPLAAGSLQLADFVAELRAEERRELD